MSEQNELCPVCGMGHLHRRTEVETFEYKGAQLESKDYFDVCDACGTEQASEIQMRDSVRSMQRARKRHDGLLSGEEIKTIRKGLGLTQEKAQELFGTGPVSFSKYEHDDVLHSKLLDRTLRLMSKDATYLEAYAKEAGVALPYRKVRSFAASLPQAYELSKPPIVRAVTTLGEMSSMDLWVTRKSISAEEVGQSWRSPASEGRAPIDLVVARSLEYRG